MSTTLTLRAAPMAQAFSGAFSHAVALLASWLQPREETPAEAACRVRNLADQYRTTQPGLAADLRAAADRHNNFGEG